MVATLDIKPVTPVIGAEIFGVDLSAPLDAATTEAIRAALDAWKVVFFRDQPISDAQQLAFARGFGQLTPAHPFGGGREDQPAIWERRISDYSHLHGQDLTVPSVLPPRDYRGWHIDITFMANPNKYSILRGIEIPEFGGDTLWANLAYAYAGLSPHIQRLIEPLQAVHRTSTYDGGAAADAARTFAALHPLVRVHPGTGEKLLFVNPGTTTHIVGLTARESRALLDLLIEEIVRPEYTVRFRWRPNSIAMWDNRATAHAGPIDFGHITGSRLVRRVTVAGDLPTGADGFVSRTLEGKLFGLAA